MPEVTPAMLAGYFAIREEQRQQDIAAALPGLEEQLRGLLAEHAADPSLPQFVARLIREATVAAGVNGMWNAGGSSTDIRPDSVVLHDALATIRENRDLYPAWRLFDDGPLEEGHDDA